jgi:dTDP-4-dehydrorhamnose 3,5-epimerase-like enzyme
VATLIELPTFADRRGKLTVIEKTIPFEIRRIFYIYGVDDSVRGGHRHHKTRQAAFCVQGACTIFVNDGRSRRRFELDSPGKCLVLEPEDWHTMQAFTHDSILMVLASEHFDADDYIWQDYP